MDREKERDNGGRISDAARVEETGKGRERAGGIRWKWRRESERENQQMERESIINEEFPPQGRQQVKCSVSVEQVL